MSPLPVVGDGAIRAFLAFEIPPSVRQEIAAWHARWQAMTPRARWVEPARQHLTLRFLGASEVERLRQLAQHLAPRLRELAAPRVALGGTGFFPNPRRPRVAWIGGTAAAVDPVVATVEALSIELGWTPEDRQWRLHLTQARLREPWPRRAVESFLADGESLALEAFCCCELVLFSSQLGPQGAVYTAIERFALRC